MPVALVLAVAVAELSVHVLLPPMPGAVNVTVAPLTGLPPASFTVACSAVANAALMVALCPEPAVVVMLSGEPVAMFKVTGTVTGVLVAPVAEIVIVPLY